MFTIELTSAVDSTKMFTIEPTSAVDSTEMFTIELTSVADSTKMFTIELFSIKIRLLHCFMNQFAPKLCICAMDSSIRDL